MLASANIDGSNRYPPEAQTSNYQVRKFLAYLTKKIVYRQDVLAHPFPQRFSAIDANATGSGFDPILSLQGSSNGWDNKENTTTRDTQNSKWPSNARLDRVPAEKFSTLEAACAVALNDDREELLMENVGESQVVGKEANYPTAYEKFISRL